MSKRVKFVKNGKISVMSDKAAAVYEKKKDSKGNPKVKILGSVQEDKREDPPKKEEPKK